MPRVTAWRLTRSAFTDSAFSGEGARLHGGRWNPVGTAVVYLAEHRSLAVLELLARVRRMEDLHDHVLIPATFDAADAERLGIADLPPDWGAHPPSLSTQHRGQTWVDDGLSLALRVPSVVLPAESNWLLNPAHPAMGSVDIGDPEPVIGDARWRPT